jgi:two-component system phosphate regulon sensor histidine kinase PhoR
MQSPNDIISLTELNEELENYFSNTIIPQLFVDADLILRKFTPPAMKHFNLKQEYIGMHLEYITKNFRFPSIIHNIKMVIATGKILEKEVQTTDYRWYQMNILPYWVRKENRTNGVILTFVDITPRILDLKEQEKLIAEHELLLDTIAHDIKNQLLALSMTTQLLKRLPQQGMRDLSKLLGNMESSLNGMKKVISDLIDTRWDTQRHQATEELLDLQNILEDVKLTLTPMIIESEAVIKEEITCSEIKFTRRKLRSVMYNLLNNAIKYTPADRIPEILIKSYRENNYMVISIADNGIGISKENQEAIFYKFNQLSSDRDGSGVGLYLVNTIVSGSGGKIYLESEPGKGSIFKLYLK